MKDFGLLQIQAIFEEQLQLLEVQLLANKVTDGLKQAANVDWEAGFVSGRNEAWEDYKILFLS